MVTVDGKEVMGKVDDKSVGGSRGWEDGSGGEEEVVVIEEKEGVGGRNIKYMKQKM